MFVGKSFDESVCLSCLHYLVTKSIQIDTDAAQLLNYTSRIEFDGSGNFEKSKLVMQQHHQHGTWFRVQGKHRVRRQTPQSQSERRTGLPEMQH